jgi:hypothetical protein
MTCKFCNTETVNQTLRTFTFCDCKRTIRYQDSDFIDIGTFVVAMSNDSIRILDAVDRDSPIDGMEECVFYNHITLELLKDAVRSVSNNCTDELAFIGNALKLIKQSEKSDENSSVPLVDLKNVLPVKKEHLEQYLTKLMREGKSYNEIIEIAELYSKSAFV